MKLTFVKNEDKISKKGNPYIRCLIKTEEHGNTLIDGFGDADTRSWDVGDDVNITVYEEEYKGKTYTKFKKPKCKSIHEGLNEYKEGMKKISQFCKQLDDRIKHLESYLPDQNADGAVEKFGYWLNEDTAGPDDVL